MTRWEAFAPELDRAQSMADRALADGRQARERVDALRGQLSTAEAGFTAAAGTADRLKLESEKPTAPDKDQVRQAVRDAEAAQQRLSAVRGQAGAAQQELDLAKSLAEQARQLRDGAARQCEREIHEASDVGIQPRSFWEKLRDAFKKLWDIICEIAKWVALVAGVIAMIIGGPLAWIALAAGAILLVKAIIDFSQGKGSVLDLVFGILGIIPGVKGLTSVSKLTALYKAGGVKEIAKATLTGMKNMLHSMVALVKAAGTGAVTISKQIGAGAATVVGAIKTGAAVVDDAVRQGIARLGEMMPVPGPTLAPAGFVPLGPSLRSGAGRFGAPPAGGGVGGASTTFAQRFQDLHQVYQANLNSAITKIRSDHAAQLAAGKKKLEADRANDLAVKTTQIQNAAVAKFDADKQALTDKLHGDVKVVDDRRAVQLSQADQRTAELADAAQLRVDEYARTQGEKMAGFNQTQFKLLAQEVNANRLTPDLAESHYRAGVAQRQAMFDEGVQRLVDTKQAIITRYENVDRPALVQQLDHESALEKARLNADFTKAEQDLRVASQAAYSNDIAAMTNQLDQAFQADLRNLDQTIRSAEQAEISRVTALADQQYAQQVAALDQQLVDAFTEHVNLPNGGTADVVYAKTASADAETLMERKISWIKQINPNYSPADVNCTICVRHVDQGLETGQVQPAPKIPALRPLSDIVQHYPGNSGFHNYQSYQHLVEHLARQPDGTRGVLGTYSAQFQSGHVMNIVKDNGRIYFVDGQTGSLGGLGLLGPNDTVQFMQTK